MSKLIIDMTMPKNCGECRFCDGASEKYVCIARYSIALSIRSMNVTRPDWCPIKGELPDEHGDLVSRDEVKQKMIYYGFRSIDMTATEFCEDELTAIIAAERKDDELSC